MPATRPPTLVGTLPVEGLDVDLTHQEQCGWLFVGSQRLALFTGVNIVGGQKSGRTADGTTEQQLLEQCEVSWAREYDKASVRGILLDDATVSQTHLMLEVSEGGSACVATDLGSRNGTWLCGPAGGKGLELQPQHHHYVLRPHDVLRLGACDVCVVFMPVCQFVASQHAERMQQQGPTQLQVQGQGPAQAQLTLPLAQEGRQGMGQQQLIGTLQSVQPAAPTNAVPSVQVNQHGLGEHFVSGPPLSAAAPAADSLVAPAGALQDGADAAALAMQAQHAALLHQSMLALQAPSAATGAMAAGAVSTGGMLSPGVQGAPTIVHAGSAVIVLSPHAAAVTPLLLGSMQSGGCMPGMQQQHLQQATVMQQQQTPQQTPQLPAPEPGQPGQQHVVQESQGQHLPAQEQPQHQQPQPQPQQMPGAPQQQHRQQQQQQQQQRNVEAFAPRPALSSASNAGPARSPPKQTQGRGLLQHSQQESQPPAAAAAAGGGPQQMDIEQLQQQQQQQEPNMLQQAEPAVGVGNRSAAAAAAEGTFPSGPSAEAAGAARPAAATPTGGSGSDGADRVTSQSDDPAFQARVAALLAQRGRVTAAEQNARLAQGLHNTTHSTLYSGSAEYEGSEQQQPSPVDAGPAGHVLPGLPPLPGAAWMHPEQQALVLQQLQALRARAMQAGGTLPGAGGVLPGAGIVPPGVLPGGVPPGAAVVPGMPPALSFMPGHDQQAREVAAGLPDIFAAQFQQQMLQQQILQQQMLQQQRAMAAAGLQQAQGGPQAEPEQQPQQQQQQQQHVADPQVLQPLQGSDPSVGHARTSSAVTPPQQQQQQQQQPQQGPGRLRRLLPSFSESPTSQSAARQLSTQQQQLHMVQGQSLQAMLGQHCQQQQRRQQHSLLDTIPEGQEGTQGTQGSLLTQQRHSQQVGQGARGSGSMLASQQQQQQQGSEEDGSARNTQQHGSEGGGSESHMQQGPLPPSMPCTQLLGTVDFCGDVAMQDAAAGAAAGPLASPESAGHQAAAGTEAAAAGAIGEADASDQVVSASPTRSPTASMCSEGVEQEQQQVPGEQQREAEVKLGEEPSAQQQQQQSLPEESEDVDPADWALWRLQAAQHRGTAQHSRCRPPSATLEASGTAAAGAGAAAAGDGIVGEGVLGAVAEGQDQAGNGSADAAAASAAPAAAAGGAGVGSEETSAQQQQQQQVDAADAKQQTVPEGPGAASAAAVGGALTTRSPARSAAAAGAVGRAPVPLFWEGGGLSAALPVGGSSSSTGMAQAPAAAAAAAAAAAGAHSPVVPEPSIGFGTQLAIQGLADLGSTPGSGGKRLGAVVGLRALSRAEVVGLGLNPVEMPDLTAAAEAVKGQDPFGYTDGAAAAAAAGGGGGKAARGRGAKGRGRGRGRTAGRGHAEGAKGNKGAGQGRGGTTGQKRRRSRSQTPSLCEDGEEAGNSVAAGAAAAAGGDGDSGVVRRSRRANAGQKAPDIMFTQAAYLDDPPSPPKAHQRSHSYTYSHLSPVAKPTWHPLVLQPVGGGLLAGAGAGAAAQGAGRHAALGSLLQQLHQQQQGQQQDHRQQQQQQQDGLFKVPAPPKGGHKRERAAGLAGSGVNPAAAAAAAAAAPATGPQPELLASGVRAQQAARLNSSNSLLATDDAAAKRQRVGQAECGHAADAAAAAAADEFPAPAASAGSKQTQHNHHPAAAATAAAADGAPVKAAAGGSSTGAKQTGMRTASGAGASPDVVEHGTRADQLPISSTYATVVLSAAAAAAAAAAHSGDSTSQSTQGSTGSGVKKKVTSRKSSGGAQAFAGRQQLATPSAAEANANVGGAAGGSAAAPSAAAPEVATGAAAAPGASVGARLQLSKKSLEGALASCKQQQQQLSGSKRRQAGVPPLLLPNSPAADGCHADEQEQQQQQQQQQQDCPAGWVADSPRPVKSRRTQHTDTRAAAAAAAAAAATTAAAAAAAGEWGAGVAPKSPAELASLVFPAAADLAAGASLTPLAATTAAGSGSPAWQAVRDSKSSRAPAAAPAGPSAPQRASPGSRRAKKHGGTGGQQPVMLCCADVSPRTAVAIAAAAAESPVRRSTRRSSAKAEQQDGASGGGGRDLDVPEGPPVVAIVKALSPSVAAKASYVAELLGGRLATGDNDPSVTHLLASDYNFIGAKREALACSLKLLLAVARGVPVVDADKWLNACERAGAVVPAKPYLLELSKMLAQKGLPAGSKLSDAYWRAQHEKSQGRSILCGMPCLLSPCAAQSDKLGGSLQQLLEAAGAVVLPGPDPARLPADSLAASGFDASGVGQPPGLIIAHVEKSGVVGKDAIWARESGFGGWPLYCKDWLIRSVLTYKPDWSGYSAIV